MNNREVSPSGLAFLLPEYNKVGLAEKMYIRAITTNNYNNLTLKFIVYMCIIIIAMHRSKSISCGILLRTADQICP